MLPITDGERCEEMYGNVNRTARARSDTGQAAEPMQIMAHFERRRAGNAARAQASPYSKARSRSYPMGIQSIAFRSRMRPHKRRVIKKRESKEPGYAPSARKQAFALTDQIDRQPNAHGGE